MLKINMIKSFVKQLLGYDTYMLKKWRDSNSFRYSQYEHGFIFNKSRPVIGIISDIAHEHKNYIQACIELEVNYEVLNLSTDDWHKKIINSNAIYFFFWPTVYKPIQKTLLDERVYAITKLFNRKIFPSADLLWLYESKRRTHDWLVAHRYPHPKTFIFFEKEAALEFIKNSDLPLVCKTDQGAAASGVFIIKSLNKAKNMIDKAFGRGIVMKNRGAYDVHQGYIIFQEFLADCQEWRLIRVGDSYFCRKKIKVGEFHSGSGQIVWAKPPNELLFLTKEISAKFEVPNINVDFFETTDGYFLVNEIHALWGGKVLEDENLEGRYLYNELANGFEFERGDFFKNRCANLRIEYAMGQIEEIAHE